MPWAGSRRTCCAISVRTSSPRYSRLDKRCISDVVEYTGIPRPLGKVDTLSILPLCMRLHHRGGMKMLQRVSGLATVAMIAGSVVFGGAAFAADISRHTIKFASTGAKGA